MKYRLYTDGSSHAKSDLPGGWAWLLVDPIAEVVYAANCGSEISTSNNRQELTAAIEGLAYCLGTLKRGDEIVLCADSQYVLGTVFNGYSPSKNVDLVTRAQNLEKSLRHAGISLTGEWIRGHSGEEWNEAVDRMATTAKRELVEVLERADTMRDARTIIAGSRHLLDTETVVKAIDSAPWKPQKVLCGMCEGVDLIGKSWAESKGIPVDEHPKDDRMGKRAGPFRNRKMAALANSLIIIWDGKSPGSKDMLAVGKKYGLLIHEVVI